MEQQTKNREWKTVRLDSIFDIQQGKQVSESNRVGANQRPFLRTANVFWGKLSLKNLDHMNFTEAEETRYALRDGDILVCEGGDVGRSTIWHNEIENCYHQNHLHRLRKINNNTDENFVLRWLQYQIVDNKILTGRANSTTIPNLSKSRLSELEITLPGVSEQKAISNVLTTTQGAIAGQEELIEKLKKLKKTMMQHLFTHGTKNEPTKMSEIGEIPESWEIVRLGDVGEVSYGIQAAVATLLKPIGYKIITNKNITLSGEIIFDKVNYYQPKTSRELSSFVEYGDVLLNWRSGSREHVGKTAIFAGEEKILHSSFILKIRTNQKRMINKLLFYYINWIRENGYFVKLQTYSVNAKFNKSSVLSMKIIAPPISEQQDLLVALDALTEKIESVQAKLSIYQKLFKTLLHELMSGLRRLS
ncbi:MAG: restriction endonuclease subunit S [Patescibacteria group bacterium]